MADVISVQPTIEEVVQLNEQIANFAGSPEQFAGIGSLVEVRLVSNDEFDTEIKDDPHGFIDVVRAGESLQIKETAGRKFESHKAYEFGEAYEATRADISRRAQVKLLNNRTLERAKSEDQAINEAVADMSATAAVRAVNRVLTVAAGAIEGQIVLTGQTGLVDTINTNTVDGGSVAVAWSNTATSTPLEDMDAINSAIVALAASKGFDLSSGHTLAGRAVIQSLLRNPSVTALLNTVQAQSRVTLDALQGIPGFNEVFGLLLKADQVYKSAADTYSPLLNQDYIYCAPQTQNRAVITLLVSPGNADPSFVSGGSGFAVKAYNSLYQADRTVLNPGKLEYGIRGRIAVRQNSVIYKKKVLNV